MHLFETLSISEGTDAKCFKQATKTSTINCELNAVQKHDIHTAAQVLNVDSVNKGCISMAKLMAICVSECYKCSLMILYARIC